jgi:hypothetical protein
MLSISVPSSVSSRNSLIPSKIPSGATSGRFEGATKVVLSIVTDPKDSTIKYRTYTVTGYRPTC